MLAGRAARFATISQAAAVFGVSFTTGGLIRYDSTDTAGTKTVLFGPGSLIQPSALTLGPDGNIYIAAEHIEQMASLPMSHCLRIYLPRVVRIRFTVLSMWLGYLA